tara:strand:- start:34 stop:243 length:210 start_codon:yes stop_codon:yes gene_type:complete
MKTTKYLYGIEPWDLEDKLYFAALKYKKEKGTRLYRSLFLNHERTEEEEKQMFYVAKALRHTQKLLDER